MLQPAPFGPATLLLAALCVASVSGFSATPGFVPGSLSSGARCSDSLAVSAFCGARSTAANLVTGPCSPRISAPMRLKATAAESTATNHMIVESAPKCAFLANTWKTQAEGARALGWTENSEKEMIKMQRISYTADLLAKTIPMMMAKAAAEKSLGENPGANIPDEIKNTMMAGAISAGDGSAIAVWKIVDGGKTYVIDKLFANTQVAGQHTAQQRIVQHIIDSAIQNGVEDVRLDDNTSATLYRPPEELGFGSAVEGEAFRRYQF